MKCTGKHRIRISRILYGIYIQLFIFTEKKLETTLPLATGIMFMTGLFLVGVATVGRLWCAQYIAGYKAGSLITVGPYSICRNPLYFFSLLGGIGVGLCTGSLVLALIVPAVFAVIYPITIFQEEKELLEIHGETYRNYISSVPCFIPNRSLYYAPSEYLVQTKMFLRESRDVLGFVLIVGIFKMVEALAKIGVIKPFFAIL